MSATPALTDAHYVVLALLSLRAGAAPADAALVAELLDVSERTAARLLTDLEAVGCVEGATGRVQ